MNKDEILQASRKENKNQDIFELEVIRIGQRVGGLVSLTVAFAMLLVERILELGTNYGYYAIIMSAGAAIFIVKAIKLRRKHEIALAVLWTVVSVCAITMYLIKLFG